MSGHKLCFVVLVCLMATAMGQWIDNPADMLFSSFHKSLSELASKGVEDMLAEEATDVEVKKDKSREELEKVDENNSNNNKNNNKDDSASQESTDGDDDDDDDDKDVSPLSDDFLSLFPNIFSLVQSPSNKPWWQKDNVCREVEEKEDKTEEAQPFLIGRAHFSSCKYMPNKYECITEIREHGKPTKKTIVSYKCCHGYRVKPSSQSCEPTETKPIEELAKELGAEKFIEMVKSEGMLEALKGAKTVFLPKDEAVEDFLNKEIVGTNEIDISPVDKKAIILNHIVPEIKETSDLQDNMVLKAEDGYGLRLNSYPGGIVTINCLPINETDKETETGVAHTVEGVLTPVKRDIADILSQEKFSKFRELLKEHNLWETITSGDNAFTVFAVNNEGIDKLESSSSMCLNTILRHHIVPITVCSKAVPESGKKISMNDLGSSWLRMSDKDGQLVVDDKAVVLTRDILAKNGVVHEIDQFVIPNSGQPASELMRRTKHTRFLDLLEKAGVKSEVDKRKDVTILIPLEESLDELEQMEPEKLKEILLMHIIPHKLTSFDLRNNSTLETALPNNKLSVSASKNFLSSLLNHSPLTIQCIPLTRVDGRVCNGYAHEIEKPISFAKGTILDLIEKDENLATFREILKGTKLEEQLKAGLPNHITVLAPTEVAFKDMSEDKLEKLKTDKELADKILRDHVINDTLCCSGVGASSWPFMSSVRTSSGKELETDKIRGKIKFGRATVSTCDLISTDGIVHRIDGIILPPQREIIFRRPNSEIILAGFK